MSRDFESYARRCGLTSQSELLKLLIKRELRLKRLSVEQSHGTAVRQPALSDRKKITAHLSDELAAPFASHIRRLGISTSKAAAILVESELDERWLESAISWEPK